MARRRRTRRLRPLTARQAERWRITLELVVWTLAAAIVLGFAAVALADQAIALATGRQLDARLLAAGTGAAAGVPHLGGRLNGRRHQLARPRRGAP